jgi:signal transduction histidine kinase/CheY-like chemotaxis protein/HPt (histidine-containing phosphotransfer) domain-containing protein
MSAINNGRIWAFIEKPWQGQQLLATLKQAVQTKKLIYARNNQLHKDLEHAKLDANAGVNAKREFLAVMSHEIRTPMNAILGSLDLLADTALENKQFSLLKNAQSSGKALLSIVNNVLDYSKIEAGKLSLNRHKFSLLSTIDYLHDIFEENVKSKGIAFMFCIAPSVSDQLFLDEQRINQVLINLIGNAIKFTEHGGVELFINSDKKNIFFEVRDTGIGIKRDHLSLLFDEFVQVDSSYQRQYEGTGLGLSISKKLVELMGGQLSVSSVLGEGSIFNIKLPHSYVHKPLISAKKLKGCTVDLINYTDFCQSVMKKQLSLWHCKVNQVEDQHFVSQFIIQESGSSATREVCQPERISSKYNEHARYSVLLEKFFSEKETGLVKLPWSSLSHKGDGERILLVEDSLPNQLVAKTLLENANYTVDIACNGLEAVQLTAANTYRLVLMDLSMPKMDGAQACKKIRATGGTLASLPIWAMTANVSKQDIQHCMNAGMNDFIEKPINKKALLLKIESLLLETSNKEPQPKLTNITPVTVIEKSVVEQLVDDTGHSVFCHIVDLFINETSQRLERIDNALGQGDRLTIKNEAHAIKSSAATLGALTLSHTAQSLEHDSSKEKLFELEPIVNSLLQIASKAFTELRLHREVYCD